MLVSCLNRLNIRANHITLLGLVLSLASAFFIAKGEWYVAALFLMASGGADLLDGAFARFTHTISPFGAFFDSVCDRYSDAFYYIGFIIWCISAEWTAGILLSLSALTASFMVSYIRARGEGLGYSCFEGFWERGERTVFLIVALWFSRMSQAVLILGIFVHISAFQRLWSLRRKMMETTEAAKNQPVLQHRQSKYRRLTFWIMGFIYLTVLFMLEIPMKP